MQTTDGMTPLTDEEDVFFCYLNLCIVYAGRLIFYNQKFPDYYMKGWVENRHDNYLSEFFDIKISTLDQTT